MSISIIIPTKNEAANLPTLLRSIIDSKTLQQEVIVVDNHSTDGTRQLSLKIWKEKRLRGVTQLRQRERGTNLRRSLDQASAWHASPMTEDDQAEPFATKQISVTRSLHKAPISKQGSSTSPLEKPPLRIFLKGPERSIQKNHGAGQATSTHLLFLDADMEVSPNLMRTLRDLIADGARAVVIPELAVGVDFWGKAVALERNLYQKSSLLTAPRLIEKTAFMEIGGFDPKLVAGEDWDLAQRLKDSGVVFSRTTCPLIHREAQGLIPNLSRKWYYTKHISRYARKHPARFARQANLTARVRIWWRYRKKLIKYPLHALAFMLIKGIIYLRWRVTP